MPTYDYYCKQCGHQLEVFQKMSDPHLKECEKCKGQTLARRPGGGAGLLITGDGFYATMYSKDTGKDNRNGAGNENNGSHDSSKKSAKESSGCCPCGKNKGSCSSG